MRAYTSADSGQVAAFGNCFVGQTDIAFTECADKLRDIVGYRAAGAAGAQFKQRRASLIASDMVIVLLIRCYLAFHFARDVF